MFVKSEVDKIHEKLVKDNWDTFSMSERLALLLHYDRSHCEKRILLLVEQRLPNGILSIIKIDREEYCPEKDKILTSINPILGVYYLLKTELSMLQPSVDVIQKHLEKVEITKEYLCVEDLEPPF